MLQSRKAFSERGRKTLFNHLRKPLALRCQKTISSAKPDPWRKKRSRANPTACELRTPASFSHFSWRTEISHNRQPPGISLVSSFRNDPSEAGFTVPIAGRRGGCDD